MTKKEIIIDHWEKLGIVEGVEEFCDNDGFVDVNYLHKEDINNMLEFKKYSEPENNCEIMLCRPNTLKGIEKNNGWTELKGVKNEITHEGDIWILNKYGNIELWLESQFLAIGYATHYKPIVKPNLPLY